MPFPSIRACLICEDVRQELGGKMSLMGLFGMSPHVEIVVQNFEQSFLRLFFVLITEGGQGHFQLSTRLLDSNGRDAITPLQSPIDIAERNRTGVLALGFGPVKFPGPGEYRLVLETTTGSTQYETSFRLSRGDPSQADRL